MFIPQHSAESSPNVQSVCLASSTQDVDVSRCVVNGWGTQAPGEGEMFRKCQNKKKKN